MTRGDLTPILLPAPKKLEIMPGEARLDAVVRRDGPIAAAPAGVASQAFSLRAGEEGVTITAPTPRGHRYADTLLAQLRRQYREGRPPLALEIEDWPSFPTRGLMLDVSRCRVPTMGFFRELIGTLADLRMNHLQLYTEHTFAYKGHEEVWRDASPITGEEIRELDTLARSLDIELVPNQACFGHMERWLRHPRYAGLGEIESPEKPWRFAEFTKRGPFSLNPTDPGSLGLIEDLLSQLLPHFSSGLVNINCDETYDVGHGRSGEAVRERGRAAVYLAFVRSIAETARGLGRQPMLWADIALTHPESLADFPEDALALAWGYEPDAPFEAWTSLLARHGIETWVCPGTSSWRSITGRPAERDANIASAAARTGDRNVTGFLLTEWGDHGHHQQWPISLGSIARGAASAWNADAIPDARAVSLHVFNDATMTLATWLDELGDLDLPIRRVAGRVGVEGAGRPLRNASALFNELFGISRAGTARDWEMASDRLDGLRGRMAGLGSFPHPLDLEIEHTLDVARLAIDVALHARNGHTPAHRQNPGIATPGLSQGARERLEKIMEGHQALWGLRSRPGGLPESTAYYERIRDVLLTTR